MGITGKAGQAMTGEKTLRKASVRGAGLVGLMGLGIMLGVLAAALGISDAQAAETDAAALAALHLLLVMPPAAVAMPAWLLSYDGALIDLALLPDCALRRRAARKAGLLAWAGLACGAAYLLPTAVLVTCLGRPAEAATGVAGLLGSHALAGLAVILSARLVIRALSPMPARGR